LKKLVRSQNGNNPLPINAVTLELAGKIRQFQRISPQNSQASISIKPQTYYQKTRSESTQ
jgi:hypothetical protein